VAEIAVEDVWFEYEGGVTALRGVSLTIGPGAVAVIGNNGGGKTTLMKHLNGLLRPTRGRVLINGRDIATLSVARIAREVALSFQNPDDQLFSPSVEAEVSFGPRNLGYDEGRIRQLVDWALALFQLEEVRRQNPADLSFSLRKRVAIASAVAMDTPVLVLDEPTTGQDYPSILLLEKLIGELKAAGRTVVTVTHDMEFVARNFDRVVVMARGVVVADGPCRQVFADLDTLAAARVAPPLVARLARDLGWQTPVLTAQEMAAELARRLATSGGAQEGGEGHAPAASH